ncbi:squalene--hopene cyclase [Massilia agilis]|uniref:Squalene--hopene cyclase n=1 Tax=Massilia agilis TaxID=1811226 RepID=A0ABT2DE63_9BURK|nr:squalene--hopene cyclase [Massilia agilis]MCS0808716.1 squalene--hopene cyclase [Massilia agilis]
MRHPDFATPLPAAIARTRSGAVQQAVQRALSAVLAEQRSDGHWVYELEADATIPSEYVLMVHYLGEPPNLAREARIARYLRRIQNQDGGWPLFHGGAYDPSASVKAYFALKMIGDSPHAPHMRRARAAIRAHGGAERCNVFTRMLLALFGQVPWASVPCMPVEIALLPRWFPFHLSRVSYWTRTVLVPLLVLAALRPRARNPRRVRIDELFIEAPGRLRLAPRAPHQRRFWYGLFRSVDAQLRWAEPQLSASLREQAIQTAAGFVRERLNGEHGLGGIFPAMVNALLMFEVLGERTGAATARDAVERLLVDRGDETYCQPCLSPVWDTALMCHALLECGEPAASAAARRALDWLRPLQVLDLAGDWSERRPGLRPGGWAFQYANPAYPDVDDTAVVAMAMHRAMSMDPAAGYGDAVARACEWVVGMQSRCGGWGAFDADNTCRYLNNIPFSDHGALLDPPTADVSARCLSMLAQLNAAPAAGRRALRWLLRAQEKDGSWYGRWGMNYVYGTWSALCALGAAGVDAGARPVARATAWLAAVQNPDGGWGEDGSSYALDYSGYRPAPSTPSQTAWAVLGLIAAGAIDHAAVERGIDWLVREQRNDGLWDEPCHTATGFERVFYLRYHGYARYFPLWALARYRRLKQQGSRNVGLGM